MSPIDEAHYYRNHLNKAYEFKEQANQYYDVGEYAYAILITFFNFYLKNIFRTAIKFYHRCILNAKAVVQLSCLSLSQVVGIERDAEVNGFFSSLRIPDKITESNTQKLDDDCFVETTSKGKYNLNIMYFLRNLLFFK